MAKWLLAGSLALVALLVLIWRELREPEEAAPAPRAQVAQQAAPQPAAVVLSHASEQAAAAAAKSGKIDPQSDEFFYRFDDLQPSELTRNAAKCYTGGLHRVHRNQKVKLAFKDHIKDGVVSVSDIKVVESTIDDPALIACFVREVAATKWSDNALPDWTQDDELVIRPERGMKKYTAENMAYEGSGPDFPQAKSAR
jgi:hypothetical protein